MIDVPPEDQIGVIAICNGKLAIFASESGFAGPVIQDYEPFDDEEAAIAAAKAVIAEKGMPLSPNISRPRVDFMKITYGRRKK